MVKRLPFIIMFCCCLLLGSCRSAQKNIDPDRHDSALQQEFSQGELTVKVDMSRMEMNVAQQTLLRLTAVAPEKFQVELPAFIDKLGDFSISKSLPVQAQLKHNALVQTASWTLEPFLSGIYIVPEMTIRARSDDKEFSVTVPEIQVNVTSLLDDGPEVADIAPMLLPEPDYLYWYLAGGVILSAAALFAFYRFKLRKEPEPPPPPPVAPHVIAVRALDDLLARNLPEQGKIKDFYLALSTILRRYIENRFQLRAVEQTTEEFFLNLNSSSLFNFEQKQLLKKFLDNCDLVKFAKHQPAKEEIDKAITFCREFINNSR